MPDGRGRYRRCKIKGCRVKQDEHGFGTCCSHTARAVDEFMSLSPTLYHAIMYMIEQRVTLHEIVDH